MDRIAEGTGMEDLDDRLLAFFAAEPSPSAAAAVDGRMGPILATPPTARGHRPARLTRWLVPGVLGSAIGLAITAVVIPALLRPVGSDQPARPAATAVTIVGGGYGYPLDDAPAAAAVFPGNEVIVLGTVAGTEPARWSGPHRDTDHVYTPVRVDVLEVLRGDVAGGTIRVRSLGGEADGVRYQVFDAVPVADLPAGTRVLLFLGGPAGDDGPTGVNMAYVIGADGRATSFPNGDHTIALADFRRLIERK